MHSGRRLTFAELYELVRSTARILMASGLEGGERVGLWAPNSIEWAVVSLAVVSAGGTVVPLNTRYTAAEAGELIERSRSKLVFASTSFLTRDLADEVRRLDTSATVMTLDAVPLEGPAASEGALDRRLRALTPDDISHIQFTSGTTGPPKGAMLRQGPMVRSTVDWAAAVGLGLADRYPVISPFSHIGGHKTGLLATVVTAATCLPFPTLDLDVLEHTIVEEGVTFLQGPPTMFHALVERAALDPDPFRSLRVAVTGAAVVPPTLVRAMHDVLGLRSVFTAYGLTETTGVCTITAPDDPIEIVAETSGRPIPGVEVTTADAAGARLATGLQGEIIVRGHNVMAGYLDDPEGTAAAVRDGWLFTGDIGWIGADGCLRIVDRLKDVVIVGGFNVSSAEVERVLTEHPAVEQAAVVGITDARLGEVPAAFVIRRSGAAVSVEDLRAFIATRLAGFKVPRRVWWVDRLPMNAAGKVVKPDLRALARQRLEAEAAEAAEAADVRQ